MRKIQDQLARQKEYAEAHKVQQKIQELEREEQVKYEQARERKIVAAETLTIQKQQQQMNALKKKADNALNEDRKLRDEMHNKLVQRFNNAKRQQESAQNVDRVKIESQFGKQMLASQTSLSYGLKKNDNAFVSSKGFQTNSPGKRGTWSSQSGRDQNPASKPSYQ